VNQLPSTSQPHARGSVCVLIAAPDAPEHLRECLASVRAHTPPEIPVQEVEASAAAVNRALAQLAPADVVVLDEACRVTPGWLERMGNAARGDTNTATASALADVGTELALAEQAQAGVDPGGALQDFAELAETAAEDTLTLHPRLTRAVGPCVYVRREALELVGQLDEELELPIALELDFSQRCLLAGLAHVAADDVLVQQLASKRRTGARDQRSAERGELPARLLERYPYLSDTAMLAESDVLARALEAARGPRRRLWVTLDARALDGRVTGTQVHVLELILALAQTGALRLRLLVWAERIDRATLELLRALAETEVLAVEDVDAATPRSTVFHRPQQAFSAGDVGLALTLGERVVLSQLDLIAYRNPGYFSGAGAWEDYRRASRHGLAAADRVVVFSDHTRRELLSDALLEPERVRVVPPGLDHRTPGQQRRPEGLGEHQGDSPGSGFLLCLGTDFRHKNRVFALRLLACLRRDHAWRGRLVLAGTHIAYGSSRELERAFLDEHPELRDLVVELGSVSEEEKAWLIAHAEAVVYPSVYEGFGLVPFESALKGSPCVFAAQSSLAEIAPTGTATILPWDPAQSATAAHALITDADTRKRQIEALTMAADGLTWAAAAAGMVEVYREAALAPVRIAATLSRDAVEHERKSTAAHQAVVAKLIDERELVLRDYDELIAELGPGRGLVGAHGALPEDLQRALLALSARPALSRPLYGILARVFAVARGFSRTLRGR
jgi:glycosyltransferase involved in cell wall biosynthesis